MKRLDLDHDIIYIMDKVDKKAPKPFLKWAGGKSRIAKEIVKRFPKNYGRYFEPFLGSGAIYFEIAPQEGILNDLNKNLINTYRVVKETPDKLIDALADLENEYNALKDIDSKEKFYYSKRDDVYNNGADDLTQAALFIFLNKAGWNGMYRESSTGKFNIPWGHREQISLFDRENLLAVSKNIQKMEFTSLDYKEAVKDAKKGDLVYFDPPYFPVTKSQAFNYQKGGFSDTDQRELHDLAKELVQRGCYVVISNSDCEKARELYKDFGRIDEIEISRTIGAKKESRGRIKEILVVG